VTIVNRRNAVLGWAAWEVGKRVAKRKARQAVPAVDTDTRRPNKPAILATIAAAAAILLFRRRKSDEPEPPVEA
jgi:hypothetical protein